VRQIHRARQVAARVQLGRAHVEQHEVALGLHQAGVDVGAVGLEGQPAGVVRGGEVGRGGRDEVDQGLHRAQRSGVNRRVVEGGYLAAVAGKRRGLGRSSPPQPGQTPPSRACAQSAQ
jgi:hypothetical protein